MRRRTGLVFISLGLATAVFGFMDLIVPIREGALWFISMPCLFFGITSLAAGSVLFWGIGAR